MRRQRTTLRIMMVACVLAVAAAGGARAQVFYSYPGAPPVKADQPAIGATVGFGDDVVRLLGFGRFEISRVADLGLEFVLDNADYPGDNVWRVGGAFDIKYAIIPESTEMPFDLSLQGGLGLQSGGDVTNIRVPAGAMISRPLDIGNGRAVVPYGGVYVVLDHVSVDSASDTDLDVELRLGGSVNVFRSGSAFAALHFGNGTIFFLGFNANI